MNVPFEPTVARLTIRQMMARRRVVGIVVIALLPVVLAIILHARNPADATPRSVVSTIFLSLIVKTLLPLTALILGTGVFGSEIDDGTAVYLLAKPLARWRIVLTKLLVASVATALVTAPATAIAGLIAIGAQDTDRLIAGFTAAVAAGSVLYCAVFVAISLRTRRALIAGLLYVILWEGLLSGLFAGTRLLSIQQYTLGIAGSIATADPGVFAAQLAPRTAIALGALVTVAATVLAIRNLRVFEIGEEV